MTIDLAARLGDTLIGALNPAPRRHLAAKGDNLLVRIGKAVFNAPRRWLDRLDCRQRARDALVRYMLSEGRFAGPGRAELERALLHTGRADILFPSYFVNAERR